MTLIQIYSVIALLLAFNVPSAKVNDIRVILEKSAITAGVQIPVTPQRGPITPVATGGSDDTSFIPTTVASSTPACDEQLTLSLLPANGGKPSMHQWDSSGGYLEEYGYNPKVTTKCGSDWVIDYQFDTWSWNDKKQQEDVVRESFKINKTQAYGGFSTMEVTPGTHTVVAIAHTINGTATTSPVTVSYISHGILSEAAFVNVIDTKAYIVQ